MADVREVIAGVVAISTVCTVAGVCGIGRGSDKYNILTITEVDFDSMLRNPKYEKWFLDNLRCGRATFAKLVATLANEMTDFGLRYSKHSFEKKVAVLLYFLGSEGGYRETAAAFGLSKSWCIEVINLLSDVLSKSARKWVKLPSSQHEWQCVEHDFTKKQGINGIVGAVDGTLIDIARPKEYDGFYNRNGDPSLNMQAIVDANLRFMSIDIRPGSYSDKKIWKMSIYGRTIHHKMPLGCYVIGDSGYTLFPWLITPYLPHEEGGRLTKLQKQFNFKHPHGCRVRVWTAEGTVANFEDCDERKES